MFMFQMKLNVNEVTALILTKLPPTDGNLINPSHSSSFSSFDVIWCHPLLVTGIIILNIMSWGSGANAWGPEKEDKFTKPNHWDGMLEVCIVQVITYCHSKKQIPKQEQIQNYTQLRYWAVIL